MRTKLTYTILLLLWLPALLFGQTRVTLSGRVTDTKGNALATAGVAVMNTSLGTYTDDDGRYSLQIPVGKSMVVVQLLGYETVQREVNLQRNTTMNFELRETSTSLDNVMVYGKSRAQQLREGAYTVSAVDISEVANSITNVTDIVNRTTGIKVRTEGGLGSDFEVSLNGMSGNSVRYFIDGVPMNTRGSEVSLANFPVNMIDHIEIYKGVVPAYLGSDALGGAINIITKREKRNMVDASISAGSFHTYVADFNAQYYLPKTNIVIKPSLGYSYAKNDYTMKHVELWSEEQGKYIDTTAKRFHDDYQSLLAGLEVGIENQKWADLLSISASYNKTDKEIQTGSIQSVVYGMAERKQDAFNIAIRYMKRDFLLKNLDLNAYASHTWDNSVTIDTTYRKYHWDQTYIETTRNEITGYGKQYRHYKRPLTIVRANLDYEFVKNHSLNFNYMLNRNGNERYDTVDDEFEPSNDIMTKHILGLSYEQRLFHGKMENAFFLKDYINHVNIGQTDQSWTTHADEVEKETTKSYLGYGVGMKYELFEPLAVKASFEHTARLPLVRELLGNATTVYANLRLKPENSDNLNVGVFGNVKIANKHLLYYEAGAFLRHVKDYIHLVVSEREGMMQYDNVSNVDVKGLEGELRYSYSDLLQLTGNITYQNARDMDEFTKYGKPSISYKNKIPNRPWLFGNSELTLNFNDLLGKNTRLRFNYQYQYVHWYFLTWEGYGSKDTKARIPTQHLHSAALTYSWQGNRYNLTLECNNLFDATAYDNYKLQKPGRSFLAKFRLLLN